MHWKFVFVCLFRQYKPNIILFFTVNYGLLYCILAQDSKTQFCSFRCWNRKETEEMFVSPFIVLDASYSNELLSTVNWGKFGYNVLFAPKIERSTLRSKVSSRYSSLLLINHNSLLLVFIIID